MRNVEPGSLAALLGVAPKKAKGFTSFDLAAAVSKGLPVAAVDRLCTLMAPADPGLRYRIVPKATLMRRRAARQRLSSEESGRVARLARVWALATEVWGSDMAARRFLADPHPLLGGRIPLDFSAETEIGAREVENILGGLKYGTAV